MNIRLNKISITNFKGIKAFEMELDGGNAVIKAENGVGKTSIFDSFLWLLFGKNAEGKKDFELRPLNAENQPLKGLVLAVEAEIDIDGGVHTFRKEHHEKVVKKQLRGYEALCWIDEVPKKVSDYQDYITKLIPENTFKLLTDLNYFNGKLHWMKRREVLLDIAGEIGTPKGFDELLAALNGRTVEEYKKVLAEQKKRYEKERGEINPRIDEIQRGLNQYDFKADNKGIEGHREKIKTEIIELDAQRQKLFETEKQRQEKIDELNELEKKKIQREGELKNDTSGVKSLLDEKVKIEAKLGKVNAEHNELTTVLMLKELQLKSETAKLEQRTESLVGIRDEYNKASETPADDTCYACGQKLPENKLKGAEKKRKEQLKAIAKRGNEIKADVDTCKENIATKQGEIAKLKESIKPVAAKIEQGRAYKDNRFAEIDKQIETNETTPPEKDPMWQALCFDMRKAEKQIGEPVSEQLQQIDNQRTEKLNAVAQLDKALAHADRMKQDKKRIAELETKESQLAQIIADVEKQLNSIDEYKATESRMIESAVNGKFKYVEFKLFDRLLNGNLNCCCEALFDGVPYADMSSGQQIFVGVDIVNILSAHYGISVPLFIDHSESLTLPIEAEAQTIKLFAEEKIKTLLVQREGAYANV